MAQISSSSQREVWNKLMGHPVCVFIIVFLKLHLFFLFQHKVRTETMVTFGKLCSGLGTAAASVHREVYKTVRAAMSDRVMPVREAGAFCLLSMAPYAQASTYSVVHI